uniref:Uncharacterized protein, isoform A n=1 Tax=Drosophila melanogaster TaxID=7227 RepID=Q8INM1_DROME|nr:uncharacterized protein Dmel_CG31406, isoform A [Drosophila melanogaster]AAN13469.1 uncharacterized protein Dmel_CG31406, isoform A [Drosophila melanogaster]|eukprot:NP_731477.1 uncharacterized protein Dmel_CG31406, isoform A [Drosophila melanogaster]
MVVTRSAATKKQNQVLTLSDQNILAESSRTKGPPVPKKNVKKLPTARQCVKVAANLLDAQEPNENEKTGTKRKDGKQLQAQNSNENEKTSTLKKDKKLLASKTPEAATNDNANPNMKPSLKKSTREHKSKKCNDIQKAGKDHIEHQAE